MEVKLSREISRPNSPWTTYAIYTTPHGWEFTDAPSALLPTKVVYLVRR